MSALLALTSEAFHEEVGPHLPASVMRRVLRLQPAIRAVEAALETGALGEGDIEAFVIELLRQYAPGVRFAQDLVLAGIAVALEHRSSPFVERYLELLSRSRVPELSLSPRVAAESIRWRTTNVSRNDRRGYQVGPPAQGFHMIIDDHDARASSDASGSTYFSAEAV